MIDFSPIHVVRISKSWYNYTSSNQINDRGATGIAHGLSNSIGGAITMSHSTRTPSFPANLSDYAPWVTTHGLVAPYGECQCGCGATAPVAIKTDTKTGRARGAPTRFVGGHNFKIGRTRPQADRFWEKVDQRGEDECWPWLGYLNADGYGGLRWREVWTGAHRVSYEIHYGAIPDGTEVCHSCDNPQCVNPRHLWSGTHSENILDMVRKGRQNEIRGEANGNAKLTEADIVAIRELKKAGLVGREIAPIFGVSVALIHKICTGEAWGHLR